MAFDPLLFQRAIERVADDRIREAMEQGAFDNLPGKGRPLPEVDPAADPWWWVRGWLRRNNVGLDSLVRETRHARAQDAQPARPSPPDTPAGSP